MPSKILYPRPNSSVFRQFDQVPTNSHIHQSQPDTLVDDIPPTKPLMHTLVHIISTSLLPTNFHTLAVQTTATLLPPPLGIPLQHDQLAQLHNLPTGQARLNQLSGLLQTRLHAIHHYRTSLLRMPMV